MIRRLSIVALALAALVLVRPWASVTQAAAACSSTNFAFNSAANVPLAVTMPTANSAGDEKFFAVFDRSDNTTSVTGVSGSVDAAGWTLAQGPIAMQGGGGRAWFYYRENASAGTEVVTATFDALINAQGVAGWCTGFATSSSFDASATATNFTASNNWDSNNATATTGGGIFGMTYTATNSITWTIDGAGESQLSCAGSGQRTCLFFESYSGSGAYGFELTPSSSITGTFLVNAFKVPASATPCGPRMLLGMPCDDSH